MPICSGADEGGAEGELVADIANGGAFGGTYLLDVFVDGFAADGSAEVQFLPGQRGVARDDLNRFAGLLPHESRRQIGMPG
uniref:Uncharacterized protein n=1 Tax=Mycobacterium riyadhense TaxID=486698 RepID=A0A653F572_9MYCO|nr:hypothetical protein BIN_B_05714 [Mycobacterium riyadhense]